MHAVRVHADSILGVPYWLPPDCDSCTVRFPLSGVDSIRVQDADKVRTTLLITAITGVIVATLALTAALLSSPAD
jgi:hypothetical protein